MTQDLDRLKDYLKDEVEQSTQRSKSGLYVCPFCGSGTGANRTGALGVFAEGKRWKCQSCGRGGDIFDFVAERDGVNLTEATKTVIARYCNASTSTAATQPIRRASTTRPLAASAIPSAAAASTTSAAITEDEPQQPRDYSAEIIKFAEALPGSKGESYLQGRGLTAETMSRFKLGYDAQHGTVTIPYSKDGTYYGQRSISGINGKHFNLSGVSVPLFNPGALYDTAACFIVESPLCAISIAQCGGSAVALGGTSGGSRLLDQLKRKPTTAALIMCLDNDNPGRSAADELTAALEKVGYYVQSGTLPLLSENDEEPTCKDPNELLQKVGQAAFKATVDNVIEQVTTLYRIEHEQAEAERRKHTGADMVDAFLTTIQTRRYEPIPTGIKDIDNVLEGGLIRQQLVLLGAPPAAGKTALAQWIFEGMATRGINSIYLNIEMSREQMIARSLARIAAAKGAKISTSKILQGYKWTDEEKAAILRAADEYTQTIAPYMTYNPDGITANLDNIMAYIEAEAQRAEKSGQPAPLMVLDYLQLLGGQPREDGTEVIKRAVASLKDYAIRHNTIAFVIMAHNREANKSGETTMESGRDTSALEYSADLQFGLDFTRCKKRDGQTQIKAVDLTAEDKRFITLKINKARFSQAGREVDLFFDGSTMTYTQTAKDFTALDSTPAAVKKRY